MMQELLTRTAASLLRHYVHGAETWVDVSWNRQQRNRQGQDHNDAAVVALAQQIQTAEQRLV